MTRGGKRKGAGRPKGIVKEPTKVISARVSVNMHKYFNEKLDKKWLVKKIEEEIKKGDIVIVEIRREEK